MLYIAYFVLIVYTVALLYITIYCLMQFNLLYYYNRPRKNTGKKVEIASTSTTPVTQQALVGANGAVFSKEGNGFNSSEDDLAQDWPFVTVQLPIYNEMYVVERLIDSVAAFDYPKDRFEIHILDDSTDETVKVVQQKVAEYAAKGYSIAQITRVKRQGFKAGALKDAMEHAKGEFMAIFDADFLPKPDFLKRTVPHFKDPQVGVVQTRWEHLNEDYSIITRLQAVQLNVHFTVEQVGRMNGDFMLQFNGTAGIWRKQTIEDAGGWEADTLTEDLDLSIRAQLKGWRIQFLEDMGSPAELPAEMNGFKSQQFRWMKGGAETAKKMLPTVWRSNLTWWQKLNTSAHLMASTVFVFILITGIMSVPLLFFLPGLIEMGLNQHIFIYFLSGLLSIMAIYFVGNVTAPIHTESFGKLFYKFLFLFPLFLTLSMGLSLHNSIAVLQGYLGKKSPFVRTPKFNIKTLSDTFTNNKYRSKHFSWTTVFEGLLSLYFLVGVIGGIYIQNLTFIIFHAMLFFGFGTIFYLTIKHLNLK